MPITDLTRGQYRKIYAGWIRGKRINSVPYDAEPTFVRVNLIADSFGNFPADMDLLRAQAFVRRRELEDTLIQSHLEQLETAKLIQFYEVGEDRYGHIIGFRQLQPAGKNGKPYRNCPKPPFDDENDDSEGESRFIQDNPDSSKIIQTPKRIRIRKVLEKENKKGGEESLGVNDSDSDSCKKAFLKFNVALLGLVGMEGGRKHPAKSAKFNTDTTMAGNWWNDIIWPDGSDPDEAKDRLDKFLKLVPKAAKNGNNPMAYLNTVVKRKFKAVVA